MTRFRWTVAAEGTESPGFLGNYAAPIEFENGESEASTSGQVRVDGSLEGTGQSFVLNAPVPATLLTPPLGTEADGTYFTWQFNTDNADFGVESQEAFAFRREFPEGWEPLTITPNVVTGLETSYSTDGKWLAVAASTGVWVMDAVTMVVVARFEESIVCDGVAFSADGTMLAAVTSVSPYLAVIDSSDANPDNWTKLTGTPSLVNQGLACAFSPNGNWLATCGLGDGDSPRAQPFYAVFNTSNWTAVSGLPDLVNETNRAYDVAFSPNSSWLAVSYSNGDRLLVLDTSDWSQITTPSMPGTGWGLDFSPDNNWLAVSVSTFSGSRIRIISTATWLVVAGPSSGATGRKVKFSADGGLLSKADLNPGRIEMFDTSDPSPANWVLTRTVELPSNPQVARFRPGPGRPDFAAARATPDGLTVAVPVSAYEWWNGTAWQDTEVFLESANESLQLPPGAWDE